MSTLGHVQYIGDTISTLGGYHEYIGGCSVHRGDIMMHMGEQVGKNLTSGGYHDACGGASW